MNNAPAQGFLPDFLDPLLDYLGVNLPSPLYSFLTSLLSHLFAAASSTVSLWNSLLSKNPSDWNAQTLLPPVITILAAYLALASLYRTTTWFLRFSFWFIKWGTIVGALLAGAGYYMGNNANAVGQQGLIQGIERYIMDSFNNEGNAGSGRSSRARKARAKNSKRPKAWDSFEHHREWQYQENGERNAATDAQPWLAMVMDAAGNVLGGSNWWGTAKNLLWNENGQGDEQAADSKGSKRDVPAGGSRSR
ncbi:hypothetical protein B0H34DRAFT_698887 [Crassisporium funariophilum]|nr:hypothetical protein B0H34DRAFT_698887 [Crassisporium funariophilum]